MQQEQQASTKVTNGQALGIIYLIFASHVAGLSPIIRSCHGSESFGIKAIIAMVFMAALTEGRWASPMGLYMVVWFTFLVYRRIETFNLWRQGVVIHTRFIGYPWLAMKARFIKDEQQARTFEPVMCLILGAALCVFSPTVGLFVMGGFISIAACMGIEQFGVYKRVQHMNDAQIEGEYFAEEFRRGR